MALPLSSSVAEVSKLDFNGFELQLTISLQSSFLQTLERLSSKPGVVAALVLDRSSNALLHTTGSFTWWNASRSTQSPPAAPTAATPSSNTSDAASSDSGSHFASMVARYVETTGDLVKHMEPEVCSSMSTVKLNIS